jgi:hypothetical protein
MDDCAAMQEMLLQWMSQSKTARKIDSELGTLDGDLAGGTALLSYVRYNANLDAGSVAALLGKEAAAAIPIENLSAMDAPENMDTLYQIGEAAGTRDVHADHFPDVFDLS